MSARGPELINHQHSSRQFNSRSDHMADNLWTLARIAELELQYANGEHDFDPLEDLSPRPETSTPTSSNPRFFRSRSNSHAGSSSNSLPLSSLHGSRPTTPSRLRETLSGSVSPISTSSRLDIRVKQIVEHVVVTSAVSLPLPNNTPSKIYDLYQSTCNCEGFYTVFSAASDYLAYYATVNVITFSDIRRKQKVAKKAARSSGSTRNKKSFLGFSSSGGSKKHQDKSPAPSVLDPAEDEWSEIDLLVRNPENMPTANVRLQQGRKFDRMHIEVPGLSPWTLRQSGVVNPTWEVAVNGMENGFVWKRSTSSPPAGKNGKSGRDSSAGGRGGAMGNLKLVHEATEETVAEFVAKKGSGFLGKLVVMGEGVEDEGWIGSVVASLLAVLEKLRRTRLEFETRIDPNWDFAAVKTTAPDVNKVNGKRCERCGIGAVPLR
ncbi:hypothetical protein EX30DRAFT_210836 [Ascodesmis nigricans]|uniref:Uncharacterized protein n=1 Tax=Ascodesmis nigricans TaxID=341454 RepID=A0A4V3SHQ3_9PEZI|nr:hypothetical protein EX30DRAFT_210836 [Ascodesmis nigricans]